MLRFHFVGGPVDGLTASEDSTNQAEQAYFQKALHFTNGGEIGLFFNESSPAALQQALQINNLQEKIAAVHRAAHNRYTVTAKVTEGEDEIVTMTFAEVGH